MKRYFVTAKLVGEEDCRQGVVIHQTPTHCIVKGESGSLYTCEPDFTIVALSGMWGETREFAIREGVTE